MKLSKRLTLKQWEAATEAIAHAQADAEVLSSTKDPLARELLLGVEVLTELVEMHLPSSIYRARKEKT